ATRGYLKEKNEEAYAKVFTIHYPDEERIAARPLKQAPCYGRMKNLGAVFGSIYGWERPNWFAPEGYELTEADLAKPDSLLNENHPQPATGEPIREKWSFRRSNYFPFVGEEVKNVLENVGIQDMSPFAKAWVAGPGAEAWLDSILANRIPKKVGRIGLCHLLSANGGVRSEFTVYRRDEGFYLVSAGAWERHDHDTLMKLMPTDGSVRMFPVTTQWGVLVVAGPNSRALLMKLTDTDLSNEAFPWLTGKRIDIGPAHVHALRVNFVGELGWELHHPIEMQNTIFDRIMDAGAEFGIRPFGIRAMMAMAIEKSYRLIGRELSIEYAAFESGLDRFVHPNKGAFLGRDALVRWRERGFNYRFV
ncbi:MAG: dimethylglycine dehydrogenase, partial [Bauldia sp.]